MADGQHALALQAPQRAPDMLTADTVDENPKKAIRDSGEQKLATPKGR
jgi:hypothetical protein